MDFRLQKLEENSVYILRQARNEYKNIAFLYGKEKEDKALFYLLKKAFFGKIPFSLLGLEDLNRLNNFDVLILARERDLKNVSCIYPLSDWSESDVQQYLKDNSQNPADAKEKEEIIRRLKELGYL